jgi:REP element-mobilizing transposase RayT
MSYLSLLYHIVYSTKSRKPSITENIKESLYSYIGGIVKYNGCKLIAAKAMADHIHLYVSLRSYPSMAKILNYIKSNSSRWLRENQSEFSGWQTKYGAFSIGSKDEQALINYINNQENHHKKISFQEEFVDLLIKYGIEYDQKYIWK